MNFYYFIIIFPLKKVWPFIWTNMFWTRRILNFVNEFLLFHKNLPLGKGGALHLNRLQSLHPNMLSAKFGWNWPCDSGEEDFFNFVSVFPLFPYYLPLEEGWPFIWTNLNPLHPRILCAKIGWNWPSGFGEENF